MSKSGSLSPDATLAPGRNLRALPIEHARKWNERDNDVKAWMLCKTCAHIFTNHFHNGCRTTMWPHGERCECPEVRLAR